MDDMHRQIATQGKQACTDALLAHALPAAISLACALESAMESTPFTSAVAPLVWVSAARLLFNGIQTKNLHLSDRMRALTGELRHPDLTPDRQRQLLDQLPCFA